MSLQIKYSIIILENKLAILFFYNSSELENLI